MNLLDLLGIHEWDIDVAQRSIDDTFEELGLSLDASDLAEQTKSLIHTEGLGDDIGASIISHMLTAAEGILSDAVRPYRPTVTVYENGADTGFFVSEEDKAIIRTATKNGCGYDFAEWLNDSLIDEDDVKFVFEPDGLSDALQSCFHSGGKIMWDYRKNYDLSDEQIMERTAAFLEAPQDAPVFFETPAGIIYESYE